MTVKSEVQKVLDQFERDNPKLKGKAYLTSGSRTWEEQLDIILDPKRKGNYLNIKKSFIAKFPDLKDKLPENRSKLSLEQLSWWKSEIMSQSGKSPGFPHVGGKAQDVSVRNLDGDGKMALKEALEKGRLKILMERVSGSSSEYGVSLSSANVFHIYE